MKRALSHTLGFMMAALFALTGCISESSQAEEFKEGTQYVTISPPIPTEVPAGKVEVTELFWYGCPHCYAMEPTINTFLSKKPDNVVFQRVPATLSPRWAYHAKLYYVGKMLDPDGAKNVHTKIFEALQKQRRQINDDASMTRFFVELGFKADQVTNALNSMEMKAMMARADEVGTKSKADSVPVIIVNGKYRTSPSMVGSEEKLLQVINYLVTRESK
ncbi:thiol:disulfide interchange protein DsbA/DsbL [Thiothrix lacustris]|uniref:thiol:disulfide interchange protein DsbA/DsbL n=1 Tax=Thiothrix lacustris TaxID=525917 RepID=UPI0027E4E3EC|nr:thiol:disulfide interchange protein DsbA/DsbL [Thiothrix lacustris]WMP16264.1 thiol:disulfide interchange protein DsbA/DsbL [Thiothrix lacustris]